MNIINPILRGFNPDPSIVRVGDDYYLVGTTMHMNPAVEIMHSKDLVNWTIISHAIDKYLIDRFCCFEYYPVYPSSLFGRQAGRGAGYGNNYLGRSAIFKETSL